MKPRLHKRLGWWYCDGARASSFGEDWRTAWDRWREKNAQREAKLKPKGMAHGTPSQ